jgi:hypothetical protein
MRWLDWLFLAVSVGVLLSIGITALVLLIVT